MVARGRVGMPCALFIFMTHFCGRCPHCNKLVDATKQMHMWRAPDILVVQLKRFSQDHHNGKSRTTKLNEFAEVPLDEVDFSPYFASDSTFKDENNRYRLYAVVNHHGDR